MNYKTNRKQVIKRSCANYKDGICLIRNIKCPLVTPFEYRGKEFPCEEVECSYFNKFVAPGIQENIETDVTVYSYRECAICEKQFKPKSSVSKYCSDRCKKVARRRTNNKYYMNNK
ncbi:hypothetical protein C1Y47_24920 [Priestia megaterium]|nr:hypothetical protein C1Y47_24920 [Priestia megaterium]